MELKPVKYKKKYENQIARKISEWFYDNIYYGCIELIKNPVENAQDDLRRAIRSGNIFYQSGAFYSLNGRFSNSIALELEKIGAKYSRYRKAYVLTADKIPLDILWAIKTTGAETSAIALALQTYLTSQLGALDKLIKNFFINSIVENMFFDLQERVNKTISEKKIPIISPKLDDKTAREIASEYTNNLEFWIKDWAQDEIIKMREAVGQMAIDGKSKKTIAQYIMTQKKVSERKALFLARNETGIVTTTYLKAKYQAEGYVNFKWLTNMDGRERPLHKELNGEIFRFDDPPVIYRVIKNGVVISEQKGLPKQTYNCRCDFTPVFDKEFLENRRKRR